MFGTDLSGKLEELITHGAVKLDSVKETSWRQGIYDACLNEIGKKSYGENLPANLKFLEVSGILNTLLPKLITIAQQNFSTNVSAPDLYNVCRLVRPGDTSEGFRGHFDSHLFTLVTPINIPSSMLSDQDCGQLHYFPKSRKQPRSEIENVLGKLAYKRLNSESGFDKLGQSTSRVVDTFEDYRPLLFLGNTTFHGNSPISLSFKENRMTILTHFFDPSSKFGVGALMRRIRRR